MALLAEELVEEWLNRQGFFTIRGIKVGGGHEIDLLGVRPTSSGLECRHVEVQASVRPASYLTSLPKAVQRNTGRGAHSAKLRSEEELRQGVREWIEKKFDRPDTQRIKRRLAPGPWSRELVVHRVKIPRELELLAEAGVTVLRLSEVLISLMAGGLLLEGTTGAHLVDLITLTTEPASVAP